MTRRRQDYYGHAHDERVEPGHDFDPDMPNPDWGNVIVHPDQKKMAVGDPTLWANTVTTPIDNDPILTNTPRVIFGDQVILAQASDRYSRSWSLTGVLQCPIVAWNGPLGGGNHIPSSPFDVGAQADNTLAVWLSVVQGIEKITFEQQILLMVCGANSIGLCNAQFTINGGPYGATFSSRPPEETDPEGRAFAAIGSLIGNTIAVRGIFVRGGQPGNQGIIPQATLSLMITPYAPGQGI